MSPDDPDHDYFANVKSIEIGSNIELQIDPRCRGIYLSAGSFVEMATSLSPTEALQLAESLICAARMFKTELPRPALLLHGVVADTPPNHGDKSLAGNLATVSP